MGRIGKKILYKAKDIGKLLLEEGSESLFYGLYLVSTPISFGENIVSDAVRRISYPEKLAAKVL